MKKPDYMFMKLGGLLKHLFTVNDDPHGIALGFGLGVFLGILPGTGPLAALVCAQFLRVNRAAALLGALLTNTWFSLVVLGFSVKLGAWILRVDWSAINRLTAAAFKPFNWHKLFQLPFKEVIFPVLLGYLVISLCLGILAYIAAFLSLHGYRSLRSRKQRRNSP
jgi:uncharacterized protein (DUF2062 family)